MKTIAIACLLVLCLTGATCQRLPQPPKEVIVTVTEYRDLPPWATEPLAKPARTGNSIEAHLQHEDALDGFADRLLCHRQLTAKIAAGDSVDRKECDP